MSAEQATDAAEQQQQQSNDTPTSDNSQTTEKSPLRRVKLYYLNDEGKWDDKGTGHVSLETIKDHTQLKMASEADDSALLDTKVSKDDIYHLQGESLIVWCDPTTQIDMALSFQESDGCQQVWDEIRVAQGRTPDSKEVIAKNMELEERENEDGESSRIDESFDLPEPDIDKLQKIYDIMTSSPKHRVVKALLDNGNYLSKLCSVFETAEELDDTYSLHLLFNIFKTTILLDDNKLVDKLFQEDLIMRVMGALEYDPDLPVPKANHRQYLKQIVVFKEVVPIKNRAIIKKIHQTFRIQYLKDIVLPRHLDDQTFNTLNTLIYFNNVEIIKHIREDDNFLLLLFNQLRLEPTRDHARLLLEFNNMIKNLQGYVKVGIYKTLLEYNLVTVLELMIANKDETIRHCSADIICSLIQHDSMIIRQHILDEKKQSKKTFLANFIRGIIEETELGVQDNLTEGLKTLADPETLGVIKDEFLNVLYQDYMGMLVSPLRSDNIGASKEAKIHVLDILSYFVQNHAYRSKNYILKEDVLINAIRCINTTEKDLILAVIRFLRSCVHVNDVFYNAAIVKHDIFEPLMRVWRQNANKYNLINSAILGLFELVKTENIKKLIVYVVEKYRQDLEGVSYAETFQALIQKYDQFALQDKSSQQQQTNQRQNSQNDDEDEEEYFNESSKGNNLTTLANYGSDDEEGNGDKTNDEDDNSSSLDLPSVIPKSSSSSVDDDSSIFTSPTKNSDQGSNSASSVHPLTPFKIELSPKNKRSLEVDDDTEDSDSKKRRTAKNSAEIKMQ